MPTVCPKCQYRRQPGDRHVHQGICPKCGIAYSKYRTAADSDISSTTAHSRASSPGNKGGEEELDMPVLRPRVGFGRRIAGALTYVPERVDLLVFWGRVILLVLFAVWGASFIVGGIDWQSINGSFLHNINLPFHEFGHVLFRPLGRFMTILGGSLFQILVPLIFVVAFCLKMRDNFAAAICLWWCGQNFIDISPYIADAPHRAMPLILGMGEEAHDWGNLLTMTNSLGSADVLAGASFTVGAGIMLSSMVWGGWLLWRQYPNVA